MKHVRSHAFGLLIAVLGAFLEPLGRAVYTQKIDYPIRFATCDARSHELQR